MKRRTVLAAAALPLAGCVQVKVGSDAPAQAYLRLDDAGLAAVQRRSAPLVPALLLQALPGDALGDAVGIAYAREPGRFSFYQFSSWTERPVQRQPRLLQRRLQARGTAASVGLLGDPLQADWLLRLAVDTIHHDAADEPGLARLAVGAQLIDRTQRRQVAQQRFEVATPLQRADAAAAAAAMGRSVAQLFDAMSEWLEAKLPA